MLVTVTCIVSLIKNQVSLTVQKFQLIQNLYKLPSLRKDSAENKSLSLLYKWFKYDASKARKSSI